MNISGYLVETYQYRYDFILVLSIMGYQKLIQSGNLVETYQYHHDFVQRRGNTRSGKTVHSKVKTRNRRADNLLRLKNNFARLVRSNMVAGESPLFVTFTMFDRVSLRQAYSAFTRAIQRLRVRFGSNFRYVAVSEFQRDLDFYGSAKLKGGSIHFHVLFWKLSWSPKSERSFRCLQWAWRRGFVDCVQTDGSVKIIGYIAKYLLKGMQDVRFGGQKAYLVSRNVLRSVSVSSATAFQYLSDIVGDSVPVKVSKFRTQWLGDCVYKKYVL